MPDRREVMYEKYKRIKEAENKQVYDAIERVKNPIYKLKGYLKSTEFKNIRNAIFFSGLYATIAYYGYHGAKNSGMFGQSKGLTRKNGSHGSKVHHPGAHGLHGVHGVHKAHGPKSVNIFNTSSLNKSVVLEELTSNQKHLLEGIPGKDPKDPKDPKDLTDLTDAENEALYKASQLIFEANWEPVWKNSVFNTILGITESEWNSMSHEEKWGAYNNLGPGDQASITSVYKGASEDPRVKPLNNAPGYSQWNNNALPTIKWDNELPEGWKLPPGISKKQYEKMDAGEQANVVLTYVGGGRRKTRRTRRRTSRSRR